MKRSRTATRRGRARDDEAAATFMGRLRDDHAGLSRVLREVDAQQSQLQVSPETARPVLAEALRYLLIYQHSVHHPREDRLFARIRAREPGLYRNMERLVREHRVGQQKAEALAADVSRTTMAQLRCRAGLRLARQLQQYVAHTREHMKREEAVFYTGSERVLGASDWAALMEGASQRDPALDLDRLAARYPRLAEPERSVTGRGESVGPGASVKHLAQRVIETCAALVHESLDFAQRVARPLRRRAARAPARDRRRGAGSRRST
jgi:hemerythrin-like domain-containing protein